MNAIFKNAEILRFAKYCMVGAINTLVCLGSIFVCKSLMGINEYLSNAIGYGLGVINSFLWNKTWVFHSKKGYGNEGVVFLVGFIICYLLQLGVIWLLMQTDLSSVEIHMLGFTLSGYGMATVFGNVLYTLSNFIYNRFITFK